MTIHTSGASAIALHGATNVVGDDSSAATVSVPNMEGLKSPLSEPRGWRGRLADKPFRPVAQGNRGDVLAPPTWEWTSLPFMPKSGWHRPKGHMAPTEGPTVSDVSLNARWFDQQSRPTGEVRLHREVSSLVQYSVQRCLARARHL
jgi:hypothetical protein